MTTKEALGIVAEELTDELVICTTGHTCREMQALCDRPSNFYMIGSMGLAPALGLGIALNEPEKKVLVCDGDGALLMGLGVLPMIGSLCPSNLIHLVLDNEVFASTGNQPTYSSSVPLETLASAAGYPVVRKVQTPDLLRAGWREVRAQAGPVFLLVKCRPDVGKPAQRVRLLPEAITQRFMEAVNS